MNTPYYVAVKPFLMTFHSFWETRYKNAELPLRERIFAIAMARTMPNLHTPLGQTKVDGKWVDTLALMVGKKTADGTVKPAPRSSVHKALKTLIDDGSLDKSSSKDCLVLPEQGYASKRRGKSKPCHICAGQLPKENKDFAVRDRAKETLLGEAYSSVTKLQANEVRRLQKVDMASTNSDNASQAQSA